MWLVGAGWRHRAIAMDVVSDDAQAGFRRIEVLTGPARRRRWSAEEKGQIVAETLRAGATVTEVARRWHVCPQQVWGWRRETREGHLALPGTECAAGAAAEFVPIVTDGQSASMAVEREAAAPQRSTDLAGAPSIEIRVAGAVVRVVVGTDTALPSEVLRAVRASAR